MSRHEYAAIVEQVTQRTRVLGSLLRTWLNMVEKLVGAELSARGSMLSRWYRLSTLVGLSALLLTAMLFTVMRTGMSLMLSLVVLVVATLSFALAMTMTPVTAAFFADGGCGLYGRRV